MDGKELAAHLKSSPYLIDSENALKEAAGEITKLEERVEQLRCERTLSDDTLARYFGSKRYEQVAESNAIEGSTLNVGETELAIEKGVTLSKHASAYVRDALALNKALNTMVDLAKGREATDIAQSHKVHEQLMGERPGAGIFRTEPVAIYGAEHKPPVTWGEIMQGMENWQAWSRENQKAPAVLRATVLHAWLTHVHPYIDGNGRTARAVSSLEFVRAGYPVAIIPRKRRNEYLEALAESDRGGDIRPFLELMLELADNALTGLEQAVKQTQELADSPEVKALRRAQEEKLLNRPALLRQGVYLLLEAIEHNLNQRLEAYRLPAPPSVRTYKYDWPLDAEKYLALCNKEKTERTWCFNVSIRFPSPPFTKLNDEVRLAYFGSRSAWLYQQRGEEGGTSLFWSNRNWDGFSKWKTDHDNAPCCIEMSMDNEKGDTWYVRLKTSKDGKYRTLTTSELAEHISQDLAKMAMTRATAAG